MMTPGPGTKPLEKISEVNYKTPKELCSLNSTTADHQNVMSTAFKELTSKRLSYEEW
jgi:hypothetical protein